MYVEDVEDRSNTPKGCNAMYVGDVEDVEDRSNTPKGCNAMHVGDAKKSFGKLRLRAFQPYHQTLCILKHVEDVEDNLRHLQYASTYIEFDGMVGKP